MEEVLLGELVCPNCLRNLRGPSPSDDVLAYCKACGECFQCPASWSGVVCNRIAYSNPNASLHLQEGETGPLQESAPKASVAILKLSNYLPEATGLGVLQKVYRTSWSASISLLIISCILVVASSLIVYEALVNGGKNIPSKAIFIVIIAPVILVLALFQALKNIFLRQTLLLFSAGVLRMQLGNVHVFRWDQMVRMFQKSPEFYSIEFENGRFLAFDDLESESQKMLRERVDQEIQQRLLPLAIEKYNHGSNVEFGKLAVSQEGLTFKDKLLLWNEVERLGLDPRNNFIVTKKGGLLLWASVPVKTIPNFVIFQSLVERHVRFIYYTV